MTAGAVHTRVSLQQEGVVALLCAASRVRRQVVRLLQRESVSPSQYNILRILRGSSNGLPTMEIATQLIDQEPGITRLIDGLEAREYVERVRSNEDRRQVHCHITASGSEVLGRLDDPIEGLDHEMLSNLSRSDLRTLRRLLDQIASE